MPRAVPASRLCSALSLLTLVLVLGGCGFQPRGHGAGLDRIPSPLHITGIDRYSALHRELVAQLQRADVSTSETSADSAAILLIHKYRSDARVLTLDSRNKAIELELEESARFELRSPDQRVMAEPQTVRVLHIQFRPPETILASRREAELLRKDMRRDLAQRVLRRGAAQR